MLYYILYILISYRYSTNCTIFIMFELYGCYK